MCAGIELLTIQPILYSIGDVNALKMITLSPKIEDEILEILNNSNSSNWVKSAVSLSLDYRTERVEYKNYIKNLDDALGYLALRSPSTYSQIYGALHSIRELNPSWKPLGILDIGSGPGTAIWAAKEIFPTLKTGTAIERDRNFIGIGNTVLKSFADLKVDWVTVDLSKSSPKISGGFDLVIIANVLNEMDSDTRNKTLQFANDSCNGILMIIEPGTPYGFETIKGVAEKLSSSILIAPYIGNTFIDSEEVNFAQKIKRPEFQKRVRHLQRKNEQPEKDRLLPPSDWEESKYYYLAYSKFKPEISVWGRIIEKPKPLKPFVLLKVLTKDGVKTERVFKKERDRFKQAKKLKWGDTVNENLERAII